MKLFFRSKRFIVCKTIFFLLIIELAGKNCVGQGGMWTWVSGSDTVFAHGVYGVKGIADSANHPPALYEPAHWIDLDGNFWIYGGLTEIYPGGNKLCNALWKYDITTDEWTWISGSNEVSQPAVYGTQGIPSVFNNPGSRSIGMFSWVDLNGDLWLYGGLGYDQSGNYGPLENLWKYTIATNEWTWIWGFQPSSFYSAPYFYSFQTFDAANEPGGLAECQMSWIDDTGHLWLMGGGPDIDHCYNAVWEYDPGVNQWAWMAGSNSANPTAVYGIKGQFSSSNHPNGRRIYAGFKDHEGKIWFFGGNNDDYWFTGDSYADLWKFDPDSLQWAWMSGSSIPSYQGYGSSKCIASKYYTPPARMENTMRWVDACDNLWMYGGISDLYSQVIFDEMWVYSPTYNKWSITYDSATASCPTPVYGTKGIPAPANTPGCRWGGTPFQDKQGRFYVFGGFGGNSVNIYGDLFRYDVDSSCPGLFSCLPPVFIASDTNICEKFCIDFHDMSANNPTSWQWIFDGGTPSASSDQNPTNICYNNPGVFDVSLITTSAAGNDTTTYNGLITAYATPSPPSITKAGDILTSSPAYAYQWQLNLVNISGATNQSYVALEDGYYTIVVSNENGCDASATLFVQVTGIDDVATSGAFSIFPNPSNGIFYCESLNPNQSISSICIYDTRGAEVYHKDSSNLSKRQTISIDISCYPAGIYFLILGVDHCLIRQKVILLN